MRIRDVILPEDRVFFDLFEDMAGTIREAAGQLVHLTTDLASGSGTCREIRRLEHRGDEITRRIFERLNQSLITPFEPEEISRLAPALDDVLDKIDWVSHQLCNYGITESNEVLKEFSQLIELSATEIGLAVASMKSPDELKVLPKRSVEMNRLWNVSSELLSRAVLELFQSNDPVLIIKLKDIYENLESVLGACNDLGHIFTDISLNRT
jgi:uncharacterized protein Yka (UPF0111/DUF47 family)